MPPAQQKTATRAASSEKRATGKASTKSVASSAFPGEPLDRLRGYYRQMQLIRRFEERTAEMYQRAKIGGYCHLNLGEEATVVGTMAAMAPHDYLFTTYREHGYAIARGIEPRRVMAELFGRTTGVSHGWGGSMHLYDVEKRLLGGYAIVGGQMPPATGAALAIAYRGPGGPDAEAVVCQLGDATTNIGAWHESLNLAAIWKLPIVFLIVNNHLGMGTSVERASGEPDLYKRGSAFRIPGVRVDGNDVVATREAMAEALRLAREERQPTILEATSWRLRGHSVVDPATYRSKEEIQRLHDLDPLAAYRAKLIAARVLSADEAATIDADVEIEVNDCVQFADSSPNPSPDQLFAHAYATPVANAPHELPGDPLHFL
ncbi:MAG TPA: pyruvate dehydrogenase (acetyl-transferring) E1 component subunit alpha [Acidothermaceae bacterium]